MYYALSLNVSSFAGDRFVNNAMAGAVEIPAYFLLVPLISWGRKKATVLSFLLAGATLIAVPWVPKGMFPVIKSAIKQQFYESEIW